MRVMEKSTGQELSRSASKKLRACGQHGGGLVNRAKHIALGTSSKRLRGEKCIRLSFCFSPGLPRSALKKSRQEIQITNKHASAQTGMFSPDTLATCKFPHDSSAYTSKQGRKQLVKVRLFVPRSIWWTLYFFRLYFCEPSAIESCLCRRSLARVEIKHAGHQFFRCWT